MTARPRHARILARMSRSLRRLAAGALLVPAALLGACGGSDPVVDSRPPLRDVFADRPVVSAEPRVCAPSIDWEETPDGGWSFVGVADLACWIGPGSTGPVVFRLDPAAASDGFTYRLTWDGAELAAGWTATAGGRIEVPAERALPGAHTLTLQRRYRPADGGVAENVFRRLALVGADGGETVFDPTYRQRSAYLSDFLVLGSTGLAEQKAAGVLFVGPGRWEGELPAGAARLVARPENASAGEATFTVTAGGRESAFAFAPGESRRVELAVPGDGGRLSVEVRGPADGLFLWGAPHLEREHAAAGTPVVVVTLDTTRRDALSPYGAPPEVTPELARFAAHATVYERAVSTAPWTLPAHVSMFTGLYPSRHGAGVADRRLRRGVLTLAALLRARGWLTAGFAGGHLMDHRFGGGRGFALYRDPGGFETTADRLSSRVEAFLDAEGPAAAPLFLFVNYFDPHYRYAAPAAFQERLQVPERARALVGLPGWPELAAGDDAQWNRLIEGELGAPPAGLAWLRAAYLAEVAFVDHELGRLFAALERHGLYDRALVVVVGDHGELLGEDGRYSHAYRLDPALVEVPLLVKLPGQRAARRVAQPVSVADLFPTVLAAVGATAPATDGVALPDGSGPRARRLLFEEHESRIHPLSSPFQRLARHLYGVETEGRRRVVGAGVDLCARRAGDGWEAVPCPDDGTALLADLVRRLGQPPPAVGRPGEMRAADREALEALGYL